MDNVQMAALSLENKVMEFIGSNKDIHDQLIRKPFKVREIQNKRELGIYVPPLIPAVLYHVGLNKYIGDVTSAFYVDGLNKSNKVEIPRAFSKIYIILSAAMELKEDIDKFSNCTSENFFDQLITLADSSQQIIQKIKSSSSGYVLVEDKHKVEVLSEDRVLLKNWNKDNLDEINNYRDYFKRHPFISKNPNLVKKMNEIFEANADRIHNNLKWLENWIEDVLIRKYEILSKDICVVNGMRPFANSIVRAYMDLEKLVIPQVHSVQSKP